MKKLTTYKELDPNDLSYSDLPIKNCVPWSRIKEKWDDYNRGTITRLAYDCGPFIMQEKGKLGFNRCAQIIERYPRDVPEGVKPLPENRPFLAFFGQQPFPLSTINRPELYMLCSKGWDNNDGKGWAGSHGTNHYAIDVSTPLAAENFPEIVEAMEYKPFYDYSKGPDRKVLKVHRLGEKSYDLEWNEIPYEEDVSGKDTCESKSTETQDEPLGRLDYLEAIDCGYENVDWTNADVEETYDAGKDRGKWEATQWKYETIKDFLVSVGFWPIPGDFRKLGFQEALEMWNAARETKEVDK